MNSGEVDKKQIFKTDIRITQLEHSSGNTKLLLPNIIVIALTRQGKTRRTVARTFVELCTNQSLCEIVTDKPVLEYCLYHYLSSEFNKLREISSGDGTRGGLNLKMIRDFVIPIPPLEIQEKIVRILETITALTAELTAKKKQYEFYRDKLLSFEEVRA